MSHYPTRPRHWHVCASNLLQHCRCTQAVSMNLHINTPYVGIYMWVHVASSPGLTFLIHYERTDAWKVRPGIYCRGSCVHALAQNVTTKCATGVNGLPHSPVQVLDTRTTCTTNTPTCELHNSTVTRAELQLLQHYVHSVEKSFDTVHKREQLST